MAVPNPSKHEPTLPIVANHRPQAMYRKNRNTSRHEHGSSGEAASKHEPTRESGKLFSAANDISVLDYIGSDDILYVVVGVVTDKAENLVDDVQCNSTTTDDATRSSG